MEVYIILMKLYVQCGKKETMKRLLMKMNNDNNRNIRKLGVNLIIFVVVVATAIVVSKLIILILP